MIPSMSCLVIKQNCKIYITTTGISNIELVLIKSSLPSNIIYEDTLSTATTYLFTFRGMFTDKYIQALKWKIPIYHIEYLHNMASLLNFTIQTFGGMSFTSSGVSNDIFKNYFILQGAKYKEDIDWGVDFVVSEYNHSKTENVVQIDIKDKENSENYAATNKQGNIIVRKISNENEVSCESVQSEKIMFANKYNIPVINSKDIFSSNYMLFKRVYNYYAKDGKLFQNKTFFLDKKLPEKLFNALKRGIIGNDGYRVSSVEKNIDFFITSPKNYSALHKECKEHNILDESKILHYQYIFDSIECHSVLLHHFYVITVCDKKEIFKSMFFYIDKNLNDSRLFLTNKILALGGSVRNKCDSGITHMIIKNKREYNPPKKTVSYKVVLSEWIDQCLYNLKFIKEDKYIYKKPALSLFHTRISNPKNKVGFHDQDKTLIFQFTGLSTFLKERAIQIMKKHNVKYIDSEKFDGCTHLIMGVFNTSEKFMCSVARGSWILIPDFINSYDGSVNFNFEKYEWNEQYDSQNKLLSAIRKWRIRVEQIGKYAFDGWRVKIYCEEPKRTALIGLIESGGGIIVEDGNVDHVFVSKKYGSVVHEENHHSINYIYTYLLK